MTKNTKEHDIKCNDAEHVDGSELPHKGIKGMLKGIICILFGHDWISYNEHAYICSRCMAVAPKTKCLTEENQ